MAPPYVTFTSKKPALSVSAFFGTEPPRITAGYGGWEKVARPRRQALTHWVGRDPLQQTIPILFDKFRDMESVEHDIQVLEQMALPYHGMLPPIVRIKNGEEASGAALHTELPWVIENIEWGDSSRTQQGFRTRQYATVILLRFVADEYVKPAKPPARNRASKKKKSRRSQSPLSVPFLSSPIFYVVKEGDTLTSIAARELDDWRLWTELADLNGLRDPDNIYPGMEIAMIDAHA
jgi:hypothetical protein